MPKYLAYSVGLDGQLEGSVTLDCVDDEDAMDQARQLVDARDIELWQRARKIALFKRKP